MIQIGAYQQLTMVRRTEFGIYLSDGTEDVLLPRKFVPHAIDIGDPMRVFVLTDSEDRPVATTQTPIGVVGDFAVLTTKATTSVGAFMDWGLDKDLFVPFAEQHRELIEGQVYVVRILLDEKTNRVIGSTRVSRFLRGDAKELREGQPVQLLVAEVGPEGARCVADAKYFGMIFPDEMFGRIKNGSKFSGFVKRVRDDGGLALSLSPQGYRGAVDIGPSILEKLSRSGGFLPYSDNSSPEEIRREFGISKGTFKKAIGTLFKTGQIEITYHGIRRVNSESK